MAEELRKIREDLTGYLQQMVDYTKQGKEKEAKEAYERAWDRLDSKSDDYIEKVKDRVGDPRYSVPVAKAALKSLNAYSKYINKRIKELERTEKKFEKLRAKLEK